MSTSNGFAVGERVQLLQGHQPVPGMIGEIVPTPLGRVAESGRVYVAFQVDGSRVVRHLLIERLATVTPDHEQVTRPGFSPLLREFRGRRRLSQSRLAESAGFDHSFVSRLESGTRMPTRDAVAKLAEAMGLDDGERDALLASAGFMPGRIENLFASEPVLSEVLGVLQDREIPAEVRQDVREMIRLCVRQATRRAG